MCLCLVILSPFFALFCEVDSSGDASVMQTCESVVVPCGSSPSRRAAPCEGAQPLGGGCRPDSDEMACWCTTLAVLCVAGLDHDDMQYLREQNIAEEDADRLRDMNEKRAFAAFRISAPTAPPLLALSPFFPLSAIRHLSRLNCSLLFLTLHPCPICSLLMWRAPSHGPSIPDACVICPPVHDLSVLMVVF